MLAVADPGFSPGGGANSQKCYYFSIFCRKLHENERIWTPRGGGARPWRPPLDPPMVSQPQRVGAPLILPGLSYRCFWDSRPASPLPIDIENMQCKAIIKPTYVHLFHSPF